MIKKISLKMLCVGTLLLNLQHTLLQTLKTELWSRYRACEGASGKAGTEENNKEKTTGVFGELPAAALRALAGGCRELLGSWAVCWDSFEHSGYVLWVFFNKKRVTML